MNKEFLRKETPAISAEKSPESAGGRFEKMENMVRSDLEAVNLRTPEGGEKEQRILRGLRDNFNPAPRLQKALMGAGILFFLGGCGFPLIDVDIKGGLKFEPYRPPPERYEYNIQPRSRGRGWVDSGGGTGIWHGYGKRDGKVKPIWEETGPRPRKKK
ncbi:MAG: hypothetical protein HYT98_04425 [Candidatus Sungbacteria bacterium]|nr:hypothetical protein [Candidatus Sungbacteria bacterium]